MKRIRKILILFLICFITGCSNYDMTMKINKNKSMIYSLMISSNSYNEEFNENIAIYKEKLEKYGYTYEQINNGNGIIVSKVFDNIDDISNADKDIEFNLLYMYNNDYNEEVESKMFSAKHNFVNSLYTANFYVDLSSVGIVLNKDIKVSYTVELPYSVKTTNAVNISEDGKRLVWDINSSDKVEIDYEFELKNYDYIYQIVAYLFAIYLLFSIISNLFGKRDIDGDLDSSNHDYKGHIGNNSSNSNNVNNKHNSINNLNSNNEKNSDIVNNVINDNVVDMNNNFINQKVQLENMNSDLKEVEPVVLNNNAKVNDELLESEDNNDISGDGVIKFNSKSIVVNNKEDK